MQALFAVHHCGKNAQAELDSLTHVDEGAPELSG
jgi:hypothetical protein